MSVYADYNKLSVHYDQGRKPIAAEIIAGLMPTLLGKNKESIEVLDAGCGTGQYAEFLIKDGYKNITLFDASRGMLNEAEGKIKILRTEYPNFNAKLQQGNVLQLPFNENSFDAITVNNVLHHLEEHPDGKNFTNIKKSLKEFYRVLAPGGFLFILTILPKQQEGIWYSHLVPETLSKILKMLPNMDILQSIMTENGFHVKHSMKYMGNEHWISDYDNWRAPLDPNWRKLDSLWALPDEKELKKCHELLQKLDSENMLKDFYLSHDGRQKEGVIALLIGKKENH